MEIWPDIIWFILLAILMFVVDKVIACKRARSPTLAKRKEWMQTYFCLSLDVSGPVLNALWINDPWLLGPGESTSKDMRHFIKELVHCCKSYHGFVREYEHFSKLTHRLHLGEMTIVIGHNPDEGMTSFRLFDSQSNVRCFIWRFDGVFYSMIYNTDIRFLDGTQRSQKVQIPNFHSFRCTLLNGVHSLATKHKIE